MKSGNARTAGMKRYGQPRRISLYWEFSGNNYAE
jgi:hypothetical protein